MQVFQETVTPAIKQSTSTVKKDGKRVQHWFNAVSTLAVSTLFEGCYLVCAMLTAKDWLLSDAEPYPYTASLQMLLGIFVPWYVYWNFPKLHVWLALLPAGERSAVQEKKYNLAFFRLLLVIVGLGLSAYVGIACWRALWPVPMPTSVDDFAWLGNGIETTVSASGVPFRAILSAELGWGILPALSILILTALLLGLAALLDKLRDGSSLRRIAVACVLFFVPSCVLCLLLSIYHHPLLTSDATPRTWLFFICVAVLGGTALPPNKVRPQPSPRKFPKCALAMCALVFVAVLICANYSLQRIVAPYTGIGAPGKLSGFVPLNNVSLVMQDATIAMEDYAFYQHHGFDWIAMHHALRLDLRQGEIKEGGSSITQQLAKNLFLSNDRTIWRKVEEAALTWKLERMLSKPRILELYLNKIDYGMGQRGVGAAARYYFHKAPDKLTLAESAILVGIVPDPMHQQVDPQRLLDGRQTALNRIRYFFPSRYSERNADLASWYPLNMLIYPDKDAWDRGATYQIPADWHGVKFYFFADPDEPAPINQVSLCLKNRLGGFLDDAHQNLHVVGIDHLGVYNDRSTRQSETVISSHAYGQAIDISGFRFADGSRISVKDHANPRVMACLVPVEAMLRRHFDVVLDWKDDPLRHQTHFHAEVKGPRPTTPRSAENLPTKSVIETMAEIRHAHDLPPRIRIWLQGQLVRQTTGHSCGEACVATILSDYQHKVTTEAQIMHFLGTENANGTGNDDLLRALRVYGEPAVGRVVTPDELLERIRRTGTPTITIMSRPAGHWIVVVGEWEDYLLVSDPQHGNILMPSDEFYARFDGGVVDVDPAEYNLHTPPNGAAGYYTAAYNLGVAARWENSFCSRKTFCKS